MYTASNTRYDTMRYKRCGNSGLFLPVISLGLWHNFGHGMDYDNIKSMLKKAFDLGITHFDLANNYGPPPGSAEENFGKALKDELGSYRDEMIISTKAGYRMWPGPYGEWGSKKNLIASLDQSLKRMGLEYVDIFYHHRPDPDTPIEETCEALEQIVRSGKALYVGISNYNAAGTAVIYEELKKRGIHLLIHQARYSMLDRWVEDGLLDTLSKNGMGLIAFSPLAQGKLSNKYFNGVPKDSRAGDSSVFLNESNITDELLTKTKALNEIAGSRGQSLAQMALSWLLKDERVTSVLVGARSCAQIEENAAIIDAAEFSDDELRQIEDILR